MNNTSSGIEKHFGHMASLIGERSRAIMLWNLLDGRAYTATELAIAADISFQSASNHLSQLINAGLLGSEKQGRHKYFRFANDRVAQAVENIAALMPSYHLNGRSTDSNLTGIKYARTCYDHLAGRIGVELTQSLLKNKWIIRDGDRYDISKTGTRQFENLGVTVHDVRQQSRKFAFPCLDWSERNHHMGGGLGAALLQSMLQKDWLRKVKNTRELIVTGKGVAAWERLFKIQLYQ